MAGGAIPPRAPAGPDCNARGLTEAGTTLVNGLIDRHMIMDVDHMDIPTFDAAMTIAEARHYPGISSGHTGIVPTGNDDGRAATRATRRSPTSSASATTAA